MRESLSRLLAQQNLRSWLAIPAVEWVASAVAQAAAAHELLEAVAP